MSRIYTTIMDTATVASAADLIEIAPASAKPIKIHRVTVSQHASESSEQLPVAFLTVTSAGAGGTTPSAVQHCPGDAACSAVLAANNSALASGTITTCWKRGDNALNGWDYDPTHAELFEIQNPNIAVVRLITAPSTSMTMTCVVTYEEDG